MRYLPLLAVAFFCVGCRAEQSSVVVNEAIKLPKGTEVNAVLLKELTSGGSQEGEAVPMMVSEDVKSGDGKTLVPKGSAVTGEVSWSRSEGTLGGLSNRPARLKFKFKELILPDGTRTPLSASAEKEGEEFELNRENTGKITTTTQVEQLADSPDNQEAVNALKNLVEDGDTSGLSKDKLADLAGKLNLSATSKLTEDQDVQKVGDLMEKLKSGSTVAGIASGGSLLVVDAALELINVAGQMGSRLSRTLGGRNIHAYVGTPVTAYVVQDVEVKP